MTDEQIDRVVIELSRRTRAVGDVFDEALGAIGELRGRPSERGEADRQSILEECAKICDDIEQNMTPEQRIDRIEKVLAVLMDALDRQGTERDGNWGYPTFKAELLELRFYLGDVKRELPKYERAGDTQIHD